MGFFSELVEFIDYLKSFNGIKIILNKRGKE